MAALFKCRHRSISLATTSDPEAVCADCGAVVSSQSESEGSMTVTYVVTKTAHGVTVRKKVEKPTYLREELKRFRNGYAAADLSASRWIWYDIDVYLEMAKTDGLEIPKFVVVGMKIPKRPPDISDFRRALQSLLEAVTTGGSYPKLQSAIKQAEVTLSGRVFREGIDDAE